MSTFSEVLNRYVDLTGATVSACGAARSYQHTEAPPPSQNGLSMGLCVHLRMHIRTHMHIRMLMHKHTRTRTSRCRCTRTRT